MKRTAVVGLSTLLVGMIAVSAYGQGGSRGISKLTLKGKTVSVEYGRPSLKGGTIDDRISQLKAGDFWRLGANKSTTFTTGVALAFGDVTVPAGEYSLWMQRQEDNSWKLVFNKQHGQWGTDHDPSQDFASVPLTASQASQSVDLVTITLAKKGAGGTITVTWGTMVQSAEFTAK